MQVRQFHGRIPGMSQTPDSSVPDGDGLTPSTEERSAGEKNRRHGIFQRVLDGVELVGNKLPHPVSLFALLAVAVVFVGGISLWSDYKLLPPHESYPGIAQDFEHTFSTLRHLKCDIFLGAHGAYFGMEEKYAGSRDRGVDAFVDPGGYKRFVTSKEQAFRAELEKQRSGSSRR